MNHNKRSEDVEDVGLKIKNPQEKKFDIENYSKRYTQVCSVVIKF